MYVENNIIIILGNLVIVNLRTYYIPVVNFIPKAQYVPT